MSNEIVAIYEDGYDLYSFVRDLSDGDIWDTGDSQLKTVGTWNDARAAECDIALTGFDGKLYMADFPASAPAGRYLVITCLRAGASPSISDEAVFFDIVVWNGSSSEQIIDSDGRVDVGALGGDTQSLTDLKDFADSGYDPSTDQVDIGTSASGGWG